MAYVTHRNTIYWKDVPYSAGTITAVARTGSKIVAQHQLETTGAVALVHNGFAMGILRAGRVPASSSGTCRRRECKASSKPSTSNDVKCPSRNQP